MSEPVILGELPFKASCRRPWLTLEHSLFLLMHRQFDDEDGALSRTTCSDDTVVMIENFSADGESNSGPLVLVLPVELLKGLEDPVQVLLMNPMPMSCTETVEV